MDLISLVLTNPIWIGVYIIGLVMVKIMFQYDCKNGKEYLVAIAWPVLLVILGCVVVIYCAHRAISLFCSTLKKIETKIISLFVKGNT
ncbi:hypothetical protein KAR26_01115 [Candidatus Parcubacteria bacterium]|nr:hypothetical protein [Candidatus Parcubacteria bacterium]